MEDFDPDLTVNPVILAKLQFEARKNEGKRGNKKLGPTVIGAPGALFKLAKAGFRVEDTKTVKVETAADKNQRGLKGIDHAIEHQVWRRRGFGMYHRACAAERALIHARPTACPSACCTACRTRRKDRGVTLARLGVPHRR